MQRIRGQALCLWLANVGSNEQPPLPLYIALTSRIRLANELESGVHPHLHRCFLCFFAACGPTEAVSAQTHH